MMEASVRRIRVLDPRLSTIIPAAPKTTSFSNPNRIKLTTTKRTFSSIHLSSKSHHHNLSLSTSSSTPSSFSLFVNSFSRSFSSSPNPQPPPTHALNSHDNNNPNGSVFDWTKAPDLPAVPGRNGPVTTVVLLGWLGAQRKHLKKYVEWYNARGVHAVRFVVDVRDLLWLGSVERVERKVAALGEELASWVSGCESDGRPRCLMFHTFSNTGYFAYGYLLSIFHGKEGVLEKIVGCVFDSGGGSMLVPKVWAAGFSAALLKKGSCATQPVIASNGEKATKTETNESKLQVESQPPAIESMVLSLLEKLFSVVLKLPEIDEKLTIIISNLSNDQPNCPHLFLYSTADRVIPYQSIELLIEQERKSGRKVFAYNFVTSPHVDHYRTFPDAYSSLLHNFLQESLATIYERKKCGQPQTILINQSQILKFFLGCGGFCKLLAKMNDLMTSSFLNYVELKKQVQKDLEVELKIESGQLNATDDPNLSQFFEEVDAIKTEIEEISDLLLELHTLNAEAKSTHSAKVLRGMRDRMESDIVQVLRKAKTLKSRLESLDRSNISNRKTSEFYGEGSPVDRTRISVTNGLRVKFREMMNEFQFLRETILSDSKKDLKRRYYIATGEEPSEEMIEKMACGGVGVEMMFKGNKAEKEFGSQAKERHEAVMDLQRSLTRLHQVFLDMAVLVETQGDKLNDIEENVTSAGYYVSGGTNSLYYANQIKKKKRKVWVYLVWAAIFIILLVCIVAMLAS